MKIKTNFKHFQTKEKGKKCIYFSSMCDNVRKLIALPQNGTFDQNRENESTQIFKRKLHN